MGIFSAVARTVLFPVRLAEAGVLTVAVTADMAAEAAVTTAATAVTTAATAVATTAATAAVAVDEAAHRYLPLPTGHVAGTVVKVYPDGRREVVYSPV